MLLVFAVECLIILHNTLLQLIKLIIKQLRLLALRVFGICEDDASIALESGEH